MIFFVAICSGICLAASTTGATVGKEFGSELYLDSCAAWELRCLKVDLACSSLLDEANSQAWLSSLAAINKEKPATQPCKRQALRRQPIARRAKRANKAA